MRPHLNAELIGQSASILTLRAEIGRIAQTDAKVLVTGESGVGKELVARAIHVGSRRASSACVTMNCAGHPDGLLESELFGHVKGSFTGAYRDKPGKLEMADGGTVFLDEVGEMSHRMQGLLLRFLETGELQRVGSERPSTYINVRVISATNRDLRQMIEGGQFREDLFYRLNVIHLRVPPLRERQEDIPMLLEYFLERARTRWVAGSRHAVGENPRFAGAIETTPTGALTLSREALAALTRYGWPGNVRELCNVVERIVVRAVDEVVRLEDLPPEIGGSDGTPVRPQRERRQTVADGLYRRLRQGDESFFTVVHPMYMQREITRENVRELLRKGLEEAHGNYRIVAQLFNVRADDYKKFLNFLSKHDCQLPFREYRR